MSFKYLTIVYIVRTFNNRFQDIGSNTVRIDTLQLLINVYMPPEQRKVNFYNEYLTEQASLIITRIVPDEQSNF